MPDSEILKLYLQKIPVLLKTIFSNVPLIILFLFNSTSNAQNTNATSPVVNDSTFANRFSEEKFVSINGIEQWVTIKGDRSKPLILFLHGGPGSPVSPYSDNLYKDLEKDFIIVQWDQRGTGRTFGQNAPEELTPVYLQANPLTVDQMASDGIALSEYLLKHLGKQKIILFGTSWGSVLGVIMASQRPDLYYAYVAHSQITIPDDDASLYNIVYKLAQQHNDVPSLNMLDSLGKPPYNRARDVGKLYRIVKKYERVNSTPAPASWFVEAPEYDNVKDNQNREDGDDYSFVNFVGDKQLGVTSMRSTINFMKDKLEFKIPLFFIQGEHDILTPKEKTRLYFNTIQAPQKEYFLLPDAAHGFNQSVLDAQYKIFKNIKIL